MNIVRLGDLCCEVRNYSTAGGSQWCPSRKSGNVPMFTVSVLTSPGLSLFRVFVFLSAISCGLGCGMLIEGRSSICLVKRSPSAELSWPRMVQCWLGFASTDVPDVPPQMNPSVVCRSVSGWLC